VVEYYHLETDSHDVVVAEGAAAETYREDGNSPVFLNAGTRPDARTVPPYAPVLHDHPTVRRIWRDLSDRAGRPDLRLSDDPDLHLLVDGMRLDAEAAGEGVWLFRLARPASDLRLVSRSAIPSMLGLAQDQRRLGVAVQRIELAQRGWRHVLDWSCDDLADGFHAAEAAERHRWTDGDAALPPALVGRLRAGATVIVRVGNTLPYPIAEPVPRSALTG